MHDNDQAMKTYVSTLPVPVFEDPAFNIPPPLKDAKVAIVTSAALSQRGGVGKWTPRSVLSEGGRTYPYHSGQLTVD